MCNSAHIFGFVSGVEWRDHDLGSGEMHNADIRPKANAGVVLTG